MTRTDDSDVPDYQGKLRLDDRNLVLIGAGQGIGRQAAHALHQAGAQIFCVELDEGLADDIAAEVDGIAWSGNATQRSDAERLFSDAAKQMGRIDGIVDIVGMAQYANLVDVTDEQWDWHFDIVLRHAYLAMQLGGRAMASTGGVRWRSSRRCPVSPRRRSTLPTALPRPASSVWSSRLPSSSGRLVSASTRSGPGSWGRPGSAGIWGRKAGKRMRRMRPSAGRRATRRVVAAFGRSGPPVATQPQLSAPSGAGGNGFAGVLRARIRLPAEFGLEESGGSVLWAGAVARH